MKIIKGGFQGTVKGNADNIFNALTRGAKPTSGGRFILNDGSIIGKHFSTKTGEFTIDINRRVIGGEIFKIRVN